MRAKLAIAMLALASYADAGVYLINQGVKYHVGDNRYDSSEDKNFVGAYPVVGQEWIQAFKVDREDSVKVDIEHIWGVDNCPYCKVLVSIDDHDMGRITQENNHEPFSTLEPLAMKVVPGKIYYLKIASYGTDRVDDFVIENVVVKTADAKVTFMSPGPIIKSPDQPMPEVFDPSPAPKGPCEGLAPQRNWRHGFSEGRPSPVRVARNDKDFNEAPALVELSPGEQIEVYLRLILPNAAVSKVGQPLELLLGNSRPSGWAMLFAAGNEAVEHANIIRRSRYAPATFQTTWVAGAWNKVLISYCGDGTAHISVNGGPSGGLLSGLSGTLPLRLRAQGLELEATGASPNLANQELK